MTLLIPLVSTLVVGTSLLRTGQAGGATPEATTKPVVIHTGIKRDSAQLNSVYLSANGGLLAVTRQEFAGEPAERVSVYDAKSGKELPPVTSEGEQPLFVSLAPNGKYLALATAPDIANLKKLKPVFRVRDVSAHRDVYTYATGYYGVEPCAFAPDSRYLLHGAHDGPGGAFSLDLVDLASGKTVHRLVPPQDEFRDGQLGGPTFSTDGRLVLYSNADGNWLSVWDVQAEKRIHRFEGPARAGFLGATFLSGAKQVRAIARDGVITTWDLPTGREVSRLRLKDNIAEEQSVPFRDDGRIALTTRPGEIVFWGADTGDMVGLFCHGPKPQSVAYLRGLRGDHVVINIDGTRESDLEVVTLPAKEALLLPDGVRRQ